MKEVKDIINEIVDIIAGMDFPVKVSLEFAHGLMDVPIREPSIAVGVREIDMNTSAIGFYAGKEGSAEQYSVPAELKVSANIYIPSTYAGFVCYDVLSLMCAQLLASDISIHKIITEPMRYDRTFLSVCMPVTLHIHTRAFGED